MAQSLDFWPSHALVAISLFIMPLSLVQTRGIFVKTDEKSKHEFASDASSDDA